jgi:two-component system, LytTR family, sensor kinase
MSAANPSGNFSFKNYYWWFQAGGWTLFIFLNAAILSLGDRLTQPLIYMLILAWFICTGLTELLRGIIIRFHWLKLKSIQAVPRLIAMVILMSAVMATFSLLYENAVNSLPLSDFDARKWFQSASSYGLAFTIWCALYFLINTVENFRKAEIENLRWEALRTETELNRLKSQLNPHFMFNAMNVIRALVDENPVRSKDAITQLSGLLRNTLQFSKHKFITLQQELEVVRDYLSLESARMEERLHVEWSISPGCEAFEVPPLMLQTLVENCIKHGIAKIPEGGKVLIKADCNSEALQIHLENSGHYNASAKPESGFGMKNSMERLQLIYGDAAKLTIKNSDHKTVITELLIPKTRKS